MSILEIVESSEVVARYSGARTSFGGGWLLDGRLSKIIYLDEAGTDFGVPVTIVAGVIVDQDKEWDAAWKHLQELRDLLPEEVREGFVFHATELYSGGKSLPRAKYDKNVRFPVLEALLGSIRTLKLPMVCAYGWNHPEEEGWEPKNEMFFRHTVTFLEAVKAANRGMHMLYPGQRATLTVEDVRGMRQWLKQIPVMLRAASAPSFFTGPHPFDAIIDTPNFVEKDGAPLIQLADAAAFAIRHYLSGHKDGLWAARHLFGYEDVEPIFASARGQAGGNFVVNWPR